MSTRAAPSGQPVDRSSVVPLWNQIVTDLRRRLGGGEFSQRFPTEEVLTRTYSVSRQTVREALRRLEADGLVVRERGRGTSLAPAPFEQPLRALYSLARSVTEQGWSEHSQVLSCTVTAAGAAGEHLGLEAGAPALYLERLRFAGDDPLSIDRSWLPGDLAGDLEGADFTTGSVYERLSERCQLRVTGGWERIRPILPSSADRRLLRLPHREAAFAVERFVSAGGRSVEFRTSLIRGDRYAFRAEWATGEVALTGHLPDPGEHDL